MGWKKLKRQDATDLQFYSDKLKSYGIFTPNSICISDDNGITNVSEISIDELQYVNNLTTDLQTTIDNTKTNILNISNYILNDFITLSTNLQANAENFSNVYSDKFNNITLDDFKATNDLKFIENNVIKGDLNVQTWVLNVSNLNKIGTNSNFYMNLIDQDNLNITSDSLSGAALNISHDFNNMGDVLSVNALNENKLKITNNGLFGLGLSNDTPSTELDVRGDIKFSGTINDVSLYELSHLSNLQTNVQQQINNIGDKLDTIGDYSSLNDIKDYCTSIQDVFINQVNNVLSDSSNVTITQKENASNFSLSVTDYLTNEKQDKIFFNVNDFNYDIDNNSLHLKANLKPWTVSVYTDDQTIGDYNFNGSNYLHNNNGEIKIFEDTIIKVTSDVRDLITTDDSSSKQNIITGSATSLLNQSTNFNFGEILVTDNNGKITTHPLDTSNLHFLINDTTSNLQQQFDDIRENITYSSNSIKTHIDDLVINTSNYVENNFPDTTNYIDNIDVNTDNGLTFDSSNLSFNGTITIEQEVGQESYWTCNVDLNNISYLSYSNVNVYNDGIYFDKFEEKLPVIVSNNSKVSLSDVTQNEDSYTYSFTHGEGNYITFPFDVNVDILMVGGGGSGGKDNGYGGEGGEIKVANIDLQKDVIYNVTVGKGGDATLYEKGGTTYAFGETARGGNPGLSSSYNYVGKKLKYPPVSLFNSENSSNEENIKEVIDEYYGNGTYKYIHNNDHLQNVYNVDGSYDTANHTPEFIDNPGSVVSIILPYKIILTEVSFIYDNTIEGRPNTFSVYGLNDEGEYILIGNNEIIETVDIADSTMKIMKSSITNDQYYRDYKISVTSITPSSNILTFHEIELYGTSIYVNNYIKFENTTISDYPLLSLPGKNYDDTLSSIDEIGENSGSGGDGGILDENGKNGKDGVVVVKWINQKTSYIQKVITENDLKSQTDISFSEDFVYNQEKNTLGLRNVEWNDNNVYIKHKNTKVFSNDIKIPEGDVYVDTIITSNIQPHYSLPSMKLGNNIEIHNPNYSDNFQKVIEIETIKSSLKPVEISESILSDIRKSYISDDNKKYSYIQFNSEDIISFGKDTVCDVLVVGGGGAGNPAKGGGSSGGILYYSGVNFSENTNYSIQVGRGGVLEGEAGEQSSVSGTNVNLIAVGGLGSSTIDGASSGTSITNTITLPSSATENLNLVPKNGADRFNIVGEYKYIKYPRESMDGYTKTYADGTIIRCRGSGFLSGNEAYAEYHVFETYISRPYSTKSAWITEIIYGNNGVISTSRSSQYFSTDTTYYGEYIIIDLGEQIVLGEYKIYPVNFSTSLSPKDFRIYATNTDEAYSQSTDTNWIQIDEQTDITGWSNDTPQNFVLGTVPIAYRYYAIVINKANSANVYITISKWELFEKRQLAIVGGGGGTGTDAPELTSITSVPDGGDATMVNIYGDDIYLAGGGGGIRGKLAVYQFPRQAITSSTTTYDVEGTNVTMAIKASSETSSYPAWKLFNGDDGTSTTSEVRGWLSKDPTYIGNSEGAKYSDSGNFYAKTDYRGEFIAIDLGENVVINEIKLWQNMQESPSYRRRRTPRNYRLYGSNDQNAYDNIQGGDWTEIFDKVDTYFSSEIPPINPVHDIFTNTLSFRYYVLVINRIYHYTTLDSEWLSFGELELFGSFFNTGIITGSQQGGGTYGYGGNSLLTTHTAGGDGLVIIKWEEDPLLFTSYCLRANKNIWFDESTVVYTSDARIKKDIKDIDDDQALQKILELQPKTYKYIDHLNKGNNDIYGFISQQVRDVFPEATNTISNYIPNIYDICEYVNDIITLPQNIDISTFGLSQDSNLSVKLINNRRETLYTDCVLMETETGYGLQVKNIDNFIGNTSNIFVYGTKVDDMVTLDKSYLFTLNVCATQILNRKVITLEQKNNDLLSRIDELENEISQIEISNTSNY